MNQITRIRTIITITNNTVMVIAVVLAVVGTISNSSGVAIMIQQQKLQQQIAYAATKGTSGSSGDGISLGDNTGGDNNSCRRERGGELGSRAGELGLSSKLCN